MTPHGLESRAIAVQAKTFLVLLTLAALAIVPRTIELGRLSLWYDEVVTMRLARTNSPGEMLRSLGAIDATRAPLHPLLLQGWLRIFGPSDRAGRAFSTICGVATVAVVGVIGWKLADPTTGVLAAWLTALSPPLVLYAREVRMYAMLTLITCLAWLVVLWPEPRWGWIRMLAYIGLLTGLAYCHPLGLLMNATLAFAALMLVERTRDDLGRWLLMNLAALLLIVPWLGNYLDHDPEFTSGVLPIRFLLGVPIAFLGGTSLFLVAWASLVGLALGRREAEGNWSLDPRRLCLLAWFVVPPTVLYVYSWMGHPLFGPIRYSLYAGPGLLILVAMGLNRLPNFWPILGLLAIGFQMGPPLFESLTSTDAKADWRMAAYSLRAYEDAPLLVTSTDPAQNVEVEVALYYIRDPRRIIRDHRTVTPWPVEDDEWPESWNNASALWVSIPLRDGVELTSPPAEIGPFGPAGWFMDVPGLRLRRLDRRPDAEPLDAH